jgi:mannosyltransferase
VRRRLAARGELLAAAAAAAVSLAVTVPRAFAYPFWQDEVGAARVIVRSSLFGALRGVVVGENHPPAFYVLGWAVHRLGAPVVWERALSVAAAALLAALVVLYAARILPLACAALAGLAVALGWQFERHGWELRPYALFALAAFAVVVAVERAAEEPTTRRRALLTGVVLAGSLVHYFFLFTLAACVLWLFLSPAGRARRELLVAIAIGLVPLAVWSPAFVRQLQYEHFATLPGFSLRGVVDLYAELLERSVPAGAGGLLLALAVLGVVLVGAARLWRDPGRGRLCALAAVVPVLVAATVWLLGQNVFAPRALIGVAPFAAIAIGAAASIPSRRAVLAVTAVAAALLVLGFARASGRITPDYDRVADALVADGWQPQHPILLFGPLYEYLHPLDWYLPGGDELDVASPAGRPCARLFVVAVGGRARALTRRLEGPESRVGSVVIGSIPWRPSIWTELRRRHGSVLGTRRSSCLEVT